MVVEADRLHLTDDARVGGDLSYRSRFPPAIDSGAVVDGSVERLPPRRSLAAISHSPWPAG